MTYSDAGQPQAPQSYGQQPAAGAEDPGKTLGIVGLVLAFVFSLAGLIVSIVARNKSKAAGFDNAPAKWGIILSIVFMVLGVIASILVVVGSMAAVSGIEETCNQLNANGQVIEEGGVTYDCSAF